MAVRDAGEFAGDRVQRPSELRAGPGAGLSEQRGESVQDRGPGCRVARQLSGHNADLLSLDDAADHLAAAGEDCAARRTRPGRGRLVCRMVAEHQDRGDHRDNDDHRSRYCETGRPRRTPSPGRRVAAGVAVATPVLIEAGGLIRDHRQQLLVRGLAYLIGRWQDRRTRRPDTIELFAYWLTA